MATGALFGGPAGRPQTKNLVEFRAGKMNLRGKMVHPDKRKGQVYVYQSEDSLMHFCWKDRTKGTVEDDLIIFPDDIKFSRVSQCTTGRVYLLRFSSSNRKFFFWMQEPKSDKDDEYCKKVNEVLNNPPTPDASRAGSGGGGAGGFGGLPPELAAGLGEGDLQNLLGNMSQQQLMQLLGGMGMGGAGGLGGLSSLMGGRGTQQSESTPASRAHSSPGPRASTTDSVTSAQRPITAATTTAQTAATTAATPAATTAAIPAAGTTPASAAAPNIQLSDLQNILTGMGGAGLPEPKENIDLSKALTPDVMIPILANKDVQARLLPFLPEGESLPKTEAELKATVKSPQFQQAINSFSAALASGQLGPLMNQFNLGEDVANAAAQGDVEAFVKAMQASLKKDEKNDEEENMEG